MQVTIDEVPSKIETGKFRKFLDRGILFWIFLFVGFLPHSIAVTEISWSIALILCVIRYFLKPRLKFVRTPMDYVLLGFYIITLISSLLSYDPYTSIGKLRAASLFTIVYLIAEFVPSTRIARVLAIFLVGSCMINVAFTGIQRAVGRGVKLSGIAASSPLLAAGLHVGDTILEVDGHKVWNPDQVVALISTPQSTADPANAQVTVYRLEFYPIVSVPRLSIAGDGSALERLGAANWARGRDWRSAGFYGHYITYSEALQLIASLAFGLFIALPEKRSLSGGLLIFCVAGFCFALLLTVTRASALSFLISAAVIVLLGANRKTILILSACAIPLVIGGLLLLQQKRNVKFFDPNDGSITWRETVQREGLRLLFSKPRNMIVGVGMDSIKRYWEGWGLFEGGIPMGHMHSDYLEIALERGIPALALWLLLIGVYARMLWRLLRSGKLTNAIDKGIVLGALGGLVGFMSSGIVHYNWGNSVLTMILYFIMGLTLIIERSAREDPVKISTTTTGSLIRSG